MKPAEPSRVCCVCRKLFCCAECRERHEKNKHANRQLNCPFCTSQKLPLKPIEDATLFCHIVFTHLPLYCSLCGEIFKQSKDLESFGTCKWWKSRHRHSLVPKEKSALGTPPLLSEGKESYDGCLTSPPELYRNTSTPMGVCQKTGFDFITPNVPNFTLQTPQTDSASLKKDPPNSDFPGSVSKADSSASKYMSFPSGMNHEETPFRSLSSNRGNKEELSRNNTRGLNIMNDQNKIDSPEQCNDNHRVEDMELTGVECKILPDTQGLENQKERRSDSMKRVRFSDQYENPRGSLLQNTPNMTGNEEYYEACDTLSEIEEPLDNSQMKVYAENIKNAEKENRSPESQTVSGSSRVVMMVVVENNSTLSTPEVIESGLKKLGQVASTVKLSVGNHNSPGCSSSVTSVDSYYSATTHNYCSPPIESNSSVSGESNTSTATNDSSNSSGILSVVANAVRSVMKNFPGVGTSRTVEKEQIAQDSISRSSSLESLGSGSNLTPPLLQTSGKRPRDTIENTSSSPRQLEFRSPLPKRPRGWYRIKAREPIARMRNNRLTSPRGVSSETQVFHQGSLSVGDTVLPLPSRAHQSTQTD